MIETSTGNVFADLELPDAAVKLAHTDLTLLLARVEKREAQRPDRDRSLEDLIRAIEGHGYDVRVELQRRERPRTTVI